MYGVTKGSPLVASAVIFDLGIGDFRIRPDLNIGYEACQNPSSKENRLGNIGCSMGLQLAES